MNEIGDKNGGNVKKTFKIVKLHSFLGEYNQWLSYGYLMIAVIGLFIGLVLMMDQYNDRALKMKAI